MMAIPFLMAVSLKQNAETNRQQQHKQSTEVKTKCLVTLKLHQLSSAEKLNICVVKRISWIKPKFHYADFHRNFPAGKVVDTNHESHGHKRW